MMNINDLVSRTWQENILFNVLLELTYQCNLDCFFCYNDRTAQGRPMDMSQYRALLEELADLGVLNLVLSGGEPLAHPGFWTIGRWARELGFVVRIKSNGHALRQDVVRRLKVEIDPFAIDISLHGASAEVHDRQTRVPGSFARLMDNLPGLREQGLRVKLNTTLTAWNEHQLEAMHVLADELGYPLQVDPKVTPRDDGDTTPQAIMASDRAVQRLQRLLLERNPRLASRTDDGVSFLSGARKHCGSGSSGLAIDPFGNVYPCVALRRSLGNLHQQSVAQIWRGNPVLEEVRSRMQDVAREVDALGKEGKNLHFCPGQVHVAGGDPADVPAPGSTVVKLSLRTA